MAPAQINPRVHCTPPEYPRESIQLGETGSVVLNMLIDVDGAVLETKVFSSSGYPRLDEATVAALGKCRFIPKLGDGQPEQSWSYIKFTWKLVDDAEQFLARIDRRFPCDMPEYPVASFRLGESGIVTLVLQVDVDGSVSDAKIMASSGYQRLDEAAKSSLRKCHYLPKQVNGQPEKSWARMKYIWRLMN